MDEIDSEEEEECLEEHSEVEDSGEAQAKEKEVVVVEEVVEEEDMDDSEEEIERDDEGKQVGEILKENNSRTQSECVMSLHRLKKRLEDEESKYLSINRLKKINELLLECSKIVNAGTSEFERWGERGIKYRLQEEIHTEKKKIKTEKGKDVLETISYDISQESVYSSLFAGFEQEPQQQEKQEKEYPEEESSSSIDIEKALEEHAMYEEERPSYEHGREQGEEFLETLELMEYEEEPSTFAASFWRNVEEIDEKSEEYYKNPALVEDYVVQSHRETYDCFDIDRSFVNSYFGHRYAIEKGEESQEELQSFESNKEKSVTKLHNMCKIYTLWKTEIKEKIIKMIDDEVRKKSVHVRSVELDGKPSNYDRFLKSFEQVTSSVELGRDEETCIDGTVSIVEENLKEKEEEVACRPVMITGEGGSGKSFCVSYIVAKLLEHIPNIKILILSLTHVALDNLRDRFEGDDGREYWKKYIKKNVTFKTLARIECSRPDISEEFSREDTKYTSNEEAMIKRLAAYDFIMIDEYSELSKWDSVPIETVAEKLLIPLCYIGDDMQGLTPESASSYPKTSINEICNLNEFENYFKDEKEDELFNEFWMMSYFTFELVEEEGVKYELKEQKRESGAMLFFSETVRRWIKNCPSYVDSNSINTCYITAEEEFEKSLNEKRKLDKLAVLDSSIPKDKEIIMKELNKTLKFVERSIDFNTSWNGDTLNITYTKEEAANLNKLAVIQEYSKFLGNKSVMATSEIKKYESTYVMMEMFNYLGNMLEECEKKDDFNSFREFEKKFELKGGDFFKFEMVLESREGEFNAGTKIILIPIDFLHSNNPKYTTLYSKEGCKEFLDENRVHESLEYVAEDIKEQVEEQLRMSDVFSGDEEERDKEEQIAKDILDGFLEKVVDNSLKISSDLEEVNKIVKSNKMSEWIGKFGIGTFKGLGEFEAFLKNGCVECLAISERQYEKHRQEVEEEILNLMYWHFERLKNSQNIGALDKIEASENRLREICGGYSNKSGTGEWYTTQKKPQSEMLKGEEDDDEEEPVLEYLYMIDEQEWNSLIETIGNMEQEEQNSDWEAAFNRLMQDSMRREGIDDRHRLTQVEITTLLSAYNLAVNSSRIVTLGHSDKSKLTCPLRLSYACNVSKIEGLTTDNVRVSIQDFLHYQRNIPVNEIMRSLHVAVTRGSEFICILNE